MTNENEKSRHIGGAPGAQPGNPNPGQQQQGNQPQKPGQQQGGNPNPGQQQQQKPKGEDEQVEDEPTRGPPA